MVTAHTTNLEQDAQIRLWETLATHVQRNICSICGQELPNKLFLEIHFWEHTGEKIDLECLRCGGRFLNQAEFLEHFSRHSPDLIPEPTEPVFKLSK